MKEALLRMTLVAALVVTAGCSLGQGTGEVKSDKLFAPDCWNDGYDLKPDFFAAVPYRETLQIRVQRGTDLTEVSDGLAVMVEDLDRLRASWLHKPLPLTLPPGVLPPGSVASPSPAPSPSTDEPPHVHMALYLQRSCHNQNVVLYAVRGTITFDSLFSGDPNEKDAAKKLTVAHFGVTPGDAGADDGGGGGSGGGSGSAGGGGSGGGSVSGDQQEEAVMMGDPRDAPPGAPPTAIPEDRLSAVRGSFRFYFERGQPGQPFP
jgi:hypothetical protein